MTAYRELEARFKRLSELGEAEAVLHWDSAVMMPAGGAEARAGQIAALKLLRHEAMAAPELAALLDEAEAGAPALDEWQAANLELMRRRWRHANALSAELVEALSRATSASEMAWREARKADDFAALAPHLARVVALVREMAAAKAEAFGTTPYDALLDGYEPGLTAAGFEPLFEDLEDFLPGFLAETIARQAKAPTLEPEGPFPIAAQRELGHELMALLGFDFDHGRLDESHHPFTGGVPDDVRITTRYTEQGFSEALMAILHETGHAMYERGLPAAWRGQPVGEARGMAMHESQSLVVEMQACRGPEFIAHLAPRLRRAFAAEGPAWEAGNLCRLYQRVERGLIRVQADEVSYPLHVILRYRLERALLDGTLDVDGLPGAWAEGMERLLGVVPPDDRTGCLQDIHWPGGEFGYFPTYTLGAVAAAQLFAAATAAEPDILPGLARGDFAPLTGWLRTNVHALGSLLPFDDLLARATGRGLDAEVFKRHLTTRYGA